MSGRSVVVLVSGGLRSAVALAVAARSMQVRAALHFTSSRRADAYRNASILARLFGVNLDAVSLPSAVAGDVADHGRGIYGLMLAAGSVYAANLDVAELWTGLGARHRALPELSLDAIAALERYVEVAHGRRVAISASTATDAQSFAVAAELEILASVIEYTNDCEHGTRGRHVWGYGCGSCDGCRRRADAFALFELSQGVTS